MGKTGEGRVGRLTSYSMDSIVSIAPINSSFAMTWFLILSLCLPGVFAGESSSSNFSVSLSRRMVNHFTGFLATDTPGLNSLIFDLGTQGLEMKVLLDKTQVPFLKYVTPTYRPGEIFKDIKDRQSGVLMDDERDFRVGFQMLFALKTSANDPDACIFSFKNPRVLAYYEQDLQKYSSLLTELGKLRSKAQAIRSALKSLEQIPDLAPARVRALKAKAEKLAELSKITQSIRQKNELVTRFSSGAYLAMLPSDDALTELVGALGGRLRGDRILSQLFQRVIEMGVLNPELKIELLGEIKNRSGRVRVANLGKALGSLIPGLKIMDIKIDSKELPLVIEGIVKPEGESQ